MDFEEKYVFLEGPLASDHSIQEKVRLLELQKLENELTNNIHLCWNSETLDTILLNLSFLEDINNLIRILRTVSNNMIFSKEINFNWKELSSNIGWNSSWFNPF